MIVKGIEIKPGMILIDHLKHRAVIIPHKKFGVAFVSYDQSCSWSENLDNIITGELREIRDAPEGSSLVDGKLLWKSAKYRINGGCELNEEQFLKEIRTYSGRVNVEVI